MTAHSDLVRVSRGHPCPVCGRPDWCSRTTDGGMVLCARVSEGAVRTARNGAHVHVLRRDHNYVPPPVLIAPPPPDLSPVVAAAVADTPAGWYVEQAAALGLPEESGVAALRQLRAHQAHYDVEQILAISPRAECDASGLRNQCNWLRTGVWIGLPMLVRGRAVGIRLRRTSTCAKRALLGGKEGLLVPVGLRRGVELLVIAEGPPDTLALLAVGIAAIGRPSCAGAVDETRRLMFALRPGRVVALLDRDPSGIRGGVDLARELEPIAGDVRVALPPEPHKDGRAWIAAGATQDEVLAMLGRASRVRGRLS